MESGTNRGGILGDDMGLGKTIQAMALIVSRPCDPIDDPVIWDDRTIYHEPPPPSKLVKTKATLVVAPVALMYQWAEEIRTKTQPGLLKVHVYHGNGKFYDPEFLRRYDVIITTITTLANEFGNKEPNPNKCRAIGTLFKGHFHRVIIDEAHVIKNKHTKSSKACTAVAATYRWCLTGTPIQNNIDELYSLIRFLGVKPYCDWEEFRNKISTPMKKQRQYGRAMQRVQALLKAVCLRRTKASMVDGKPILNLPARNVQRVPTLFSDDERAFYVALETRTRERFNAYVKAGTVMKNYSNILVLLLRLRQACCHPHLINDFEKAMDDKTPQDKRAHTDRLLDGLLKDIRRRLIERGLDAIECPICMDVGEESVILSGCGHIYCRACITAHLSRHDEEERRCPECRRLAPIENLISVADFNARFNPTPVAEAEDPKGKGKASDDESSRHPDILPPIPVPEELETWISSSKTDKMIEIVRSVQAKGEKIIVFSQFTSLLTLMERPLRDEGIKFLRYDGAMRPEQRNEAIIRMTNDPTIPLMLISLKCGSLGLNLTIANHVVIMDPWWNPALENQAIDRVHRIGQTKEVFVHRLCIPETVEDRILALQAKKQALADGALGEGTVPKLAKLGLQELMYLFRGDV
ncbi:SNF2 family N-terminal domain-domain-containing protein [Lobosporangium transversale]|uniref:SNF2 family N-terminal domain-domain-containing protein n=1 Tax=Lobosporangium transversale TaxID=64571 RepID=A0A1Y2GJI3_9FUNG|nr:SNF2 family N-terminal domain-domain-containing protein [Lobosporangium transversale]ORZ12900.1 SNF2 family N-terminal domain-domain-containing protein [Lobosporangium transversale]|eukprot:XP_021880249.1 SNF2 family N-terminal domain-domain-containing protein [Lobosporangium transversale]